MNRSLILPGMLIGLALIVMVQNTGLVVINVLLWRMHGSLALVLLLAFGLGYLTSLFVSVSVKVRRR